MRKTASTSMNLPTVAGARRRNNQRGRGARRICQKPSGSRTPARARRLVHIDPGWDTDAGWNALAEGLKAAGASSADVTGIVVTHIHPDHHGLSARLRAASGAWVAM